VTFGFVDYCTIARPPHNHLPLVNVSYRPLFSTLSVGNVILSLGLLLQETRLVLCSSHYSLLTPVAETLQSLLFPVVWQGAYIPMVPYDMLDILEAPMPFLFGLPGRYLNEHPASERPLGVVFCD